MTITDGDRVSKHSIKAIRIIKNISAQTREEFKWFNAEHVGKTVSSQQRIALQNIGAIQVQALYA